MDLGCTHGAFDPCPWQWRMLQIPFGFNPSPPNIPIPPYNNLDHVQDCIGWANDPWVPSYAFGNCYGCDGAPPYFSLANALAPIVLI
eukprot:6758892-Karenia_brevis.AAC.1